MPSQASIEIASIFDDVITNNLKYCCVCLRTEEERKLVDPEHFMKCLQIMRVQIPVVTTVCYVCEAESTRAYALFQAINFASIINQWFKDMASKLKYKVEMPDYLDRHIAKQRRYVGKWPLPEWWRRVRARSDLVQTEVLIVSDATMEEADRDVVELSLQPERPSPPPAPHTAPELDSIVIIDDDEDPLEVHAPPPPLTPAPISIPPHVTVGRNAPTIIAIEQFVNSSSSITNDIILPDNNVIVPQNKDNVARYLLQPIMLGSDGSYHFLGSALDEQQQIQSENQNIQVIEDNCKVLEVGPMESERSESISVTDVQTLTEGGVGDVEGQKDRGGAEKRPVMSGRIDWEDKIPMDVISFVDASDPMIQTDAPARQPCALHGSMPRKRYKNDDMR